jgi:hypothetical protein
VAITETAVGNDEIIQYVTDHWENQTLAEAGIQPLDAALTALAGGSDFVDFSGPTTSTKTFTLPDSSETLLYSGGALGTPSGGTLTNATGLPISTGVSGLGTNVATFLGTPSVANLASALTDEDFTPGSEASVEGVIDLADIQEKDIDSLTGQANWATAATKETADLIISGVEVDFHAGAANAWPKLLGEATPTGTDCDAAAEYGRLMFDTDADTDGSVMVCTAAGWKEVDDDGGAGGFASFDIDGDNNSPQTITDGQEALFVGGAGIDTTAGATDQISFAFDATEITGPVTWDAGGAASHVWNWNLTAGDPQITFGNGVVNVTSGTLQQGGSAVLYSGGALGTPATGTLTNATGLPVAGISNLGTNVGTFLTTPSVANLNAALTDEHAGTDISADLEEEGQINATAVTGNAADDQVLLGSGANALAYATIPDCHTGSMLTYTQSTNTWACEVDDGGSGVAPYTESCSPCSSMTATFEEHGGDADTAIIAAFDTDTGEDFDGFEVDRDNPTADDILVTFAGSGNYKIVVNTGGGAEQEQHASEHQHSGADEVATATPGANAIPKAGAGGDLADGWIADKFRTRQFGFMIGADSGSVLVDGDDQPTGWANLLGGGFTIDEVWCEADAGSPTVMLVRDDGSPQNMFSAALTCTSSRACSKLGATTSADGSTSCVATLEAAEDTLAVGDLIDYQIVSAGGTAKRITFMVRGTVD